MATYTWTVWNDVYTTGSATTTGTSGTSIVWTNWNSAATTLSPSTSVTWQYWNSMTTGTIAVTAVPQPTAEELVAQRQLAERYAEEARQRELVATAARVKAEALLQEHLDAEQQATLAKDGAFLVSVKSGRRYKIQRGQAGNVFELAHNGNHHVRRFCIHPSDSVPDPDAMLAQKLLLETDEAAFLRIANITELPRVA